MTNYYHNIANILKTTTTETLGAGKKAQWVRALATKAADQGMNYISTSQELTPSYKLTYMHLPTIQQINKYKNVQTNIKYLTFLSILKFFKPKTY